MAGIYIHIPYCKQACIYCDFHFSTTLKNKTLLLQAIREEMKLRKDELNNETIETIYFGGGTPSICNSTELREILQEVHTSFKVAPGAEITLEANPDDLDPETLQGLKKAGINRLSIGVQSFHEADLRWMNRAHNVQQALQSIRDAQHIGLDNISADLIFATPLTTLEKLQYNLEVFADLDLPHLSCYNLTVEEKTLLHQQVRTEKIKPLQDEQAAKQFYFIHDFLTQRGYEHYEISNYAQPGAESRHNTAYWQRKKYLGFGPSAHSFNGNSRSWNIKNNEIYIQRIAQKELPSGKEVLTQNDKFNEILLTGLRTQQGVSLVTLEKEFPENYALIKPNIEQMLAAGTLQQNTDHIVIAHDSLILADGIAAELFVVNEES